MIVSCTGFVLSQPRLYHFSHSNLTTARVPTISHCVRRAIIFCFPVFPFELLCNPNPECFLPPLSKHGNQCNHPLSTQSTPSIIFNAVYLIVTQCPTHDHDIIPHFFPLINPFSSFPHPKPIVQKYVSVFVRRLPAHFHAPTPPLRVPSLHSLLRLNAPLVPLLDCSSRPITLLF